MPNGFDNLVCILGVRMIWLMLLMCTGGGIFVTKFNEIDAYGICTFDTKINATYFGFGG